MKSILRLLTIAIIATSFANIGCGGQTETSPKETCDSTKLTIHVLNGSIDSVNNCLSQGVNPNTSNENGLTLLMIAAAKGYDTIAQALLSKTADVNAKTTKDGITPLMFATTFGHISTVKMLIEQGHADISIQDNSDKRSALDWLLVRNSLKWAVRGTKTEEDSISNSIGKYLISKGAVLKRRDGLESLLTFAVVPDLSELLNQPQTHK